MRRETGCPEGEGLLEYVDSLASLDEQEAALAVIHRHELAGAEQATWMPGAEALLARLCARGIPMAILTRNSREVSRLTLERLDCPIDFLVCREDAPPKPDPSGLLMIASRWDIQAGELAYIGDFRFDIEAANRAGMRSVLYLQDKNRSYAAKAALCFEHFEELEALLFRPS